MKELRELLELDINKNLYQIILSSPRTKDKVSKIKIRGIIHKNELFFQESRFVDTKVIHANYRKAEMIEIILNELTEEFKQILIETTTHQTTALISKKGKVSLKRKQNPHQGKEKTIDLSHNRSKKYILEEGIPIPFLIDLGIQTKEGKIVASKYDKFKQINRYLEFIEDILSTLKKKDKITILDFGCGKSYLTFAMYYYLKILQKLDVSIIGLDLKTEVIENCNLLKVKYGYEGLEFRHGDIGTYQGQVEVDMVVTLHACDTATDYALEKAVAWKASVIFSVPCCQHEINKQISNDLLQPILKYGLLKERMSALLTDGIRANFLELNGYETQVIEFIDMEHTPKNILIRAVKKPDFKEDKCLVTMKEQMDTLLKELHINPTIEKLL